MPESHDGWTSGDAYQRFMGRWSPFLAEIFVPWVGAPAGSEWLDVGCGCVRKRSARVGESTRLRRARFSASIDLSDD